MITLYSKDFITKYGTIDSLCEAFVEEERNGLFELSFIMLNTDSFFNYVKEDNIVVVNANDTLLNQKFRIYMTRKLMNNRVEVFARHISFDLMYDYIDNVSFENQSCEYALNQLFRSSNFSKHYRGYSDIVNAQDYSMSMANVLEAIGGKQGSIIDTFGTGAEILRDNENIHVLNKRGYDNEVTIEYKKNLTGFELEEDTTDLVTRILPYAKYNDENNGEIIVKADYVDSPLIANYSHPYIASVDYSDKFENDEIPTTSKLQELARKEYRDNKVDIPKQNFKIEFTPLSKCVGYEGLEDKISLCDIVTIVDTRYNIRTQSKVIKTVFNVLKNRYESMELGDPKTSLGNIIGNNDSLKGEKGDKGDKGDKGEDGSIGDFPNSLPATPVVTATVYGFANIEISWTFENKVYYQYEVYASKEADFTPNTFNLIHQGQTSTFMYQAKPNETWYFKVCCVNTHGERTNFGSAYAITSKVDDLSNYVSNMAIDDALIGTLRLDRGWIGTLRGNYIDAKQLSVTDGNGKRTLDIDSFGNVNLDVATLKINSRNVATEDNINDLSYRVSNAEAKITDEAITNVVSQSFYTKDDINNKGYQTYSQVKQEVDKLQIKFSESGGYNLLQNGNFKRGLECWEVTDSIGALCIGNTSSCAYNTNELSMAGAHNYAMWVSQGVDWDSNEPITLSYWQWTSLNGEDGWTNMFRSAQVIISYTDGSQSWHSAPTQWTFNTWEKFSVTVYPEEGKRVRYISVDLWCRDTSKVVCYTNVMLEKGTMATEYTPSPNEIKEGIVTVDKNGVKVSHDNGDYTQLHAEGLKRYRSNGDAKGDYHYLTQYVGFSGQDTVWVQLKNDFKGKHFTAYSVISDTWEDSWNHGDPWVIQRFVTYVQTDMIDYENARVPVLVYRIDKNYKTGEYRKKPCAGVLLVVA